MNSIDKVFGMLAIAIVVAAASFAVVNSYFGPAASAPQTATSGSTTTATGLPTVTLASGPRVNEKCECYRKAVSVAKDENHNATSPLYEAGFRDCYERLGGEGGAYWTAGWRASEDNPRRPQSCRTFEASRR
ncbi:MAG: hypothetical protein AAFR11_07340 [Pseudomonadota bacterium]